VAALLAVAVPVLAQQQAAAPVAQAASPAAKAFSQQELDELLAPIALYPDALLAQVLMASTYPLQVVEAARWVKANPSLKDKALEDALQKQDWDPAVKALTTLPQVLTMMNEKLDWTQKLGDAFLAQQADVMKTAQTLRAKAQAAGNLKSTPEQTVKTEKEGDKTVYIIESAKPEVVYVPTYNPATIYGPWWYSYPPPYYYYPPGYVAGAGFWFATGVIVGGAIWGNCGWGRNEVNINVNKYNNFNKTNIQNNNFQHNAANRKGVPYKDNATAQKYNKGTDRAAAQSREQFRGQADAGRQQLQGMDKSQLQGQVGAADRAGGQASRAGGGDRAGASAGTRDTGSRGGGASASSRQSGGFSGAGSGASTSAASSRGASSRASAGGGARGGGGGGRGGGRR
ncbi:MAG: DUF3300 domain-containing protein, partial [Betaproteobacteria bacterium]|nr:DUF3300 domain-containing protein [Betaproteobacteria bacterium]